MPEEADGIIAAVSLQSLVDLPTPAAPASTESSGRSPNWSTTSGGRSRFRTASSCSSGSGVVPDQSFTLAPDNRVVITIGGIGTLDNGVVLVA